MTVKELEAKVADLESRLAFEKKKSAYWESLVEDLRMRARALSEELDLCK